MIDKTTEPEQDADPQGRNEALVMRHWYCLSFIGKAAEGGGECQASSYHGYADRKVTKAKIAEAKKYAGVTENAVLIACSYLGYMTKEEMADA
jgi:hypothetical protein